MHFDMDEDEAAIFDMAKAFGQDQIAPYALQWEKDETIPRAVLREAGALGFGGLYVSEAAGGSGLTRLQGTLVFEALAMACPSVAAFISIHNMVGAMIDRYGDDATKARLLPDMCSFAKVASYCLTEPGSGSDAAALRTSAAKSNDAYTLNGTKAFISGGGYSDIYAVMCRTGGAGPKGVSTILVEDGTAGLSFGALEQKMGWRAQPTTQVQFDDCAVPLGNLLGEEGKGFSYAMAGLDGGRLNIAACSLGAAQTALDKAIAYMQDRKAFGQNLTQFQALQFKVAEMEIAVQAARTFLHKAAWKLDTGAADATKFCAMAKRFVTDACFDVVNDALQLHGGYGYLADYGIEKLVRDLRVHQILEGTNEIMCLITARAVFAEHS